MRPKPVSILAIPMLLLGMAISAPAVAAPPGTQQTVTQQHQHHPHRPTIVHRAVPRPEATMPVARVRDRERERARVEMRHPRVVVDRRHFHRNIVAQRRFHWRPYHRPHGWYYRHWRFGEFLPRIFWVHTYWITSYWSFDLPMPPPGCVWVRYGDDALLVDTTTGEIIEVMYNLFW